MMTPSSPPCRFVDDDNKYKKFAKQSPRHSQKYNEALAFFNVEVVPRALRNSSFVLAWVYLSLGAVYLLMGGGDPSYTNVEKFSNFASISIEGLGLLTLRHKIQGRNSVKGISGMTMIMYAVVYSIRVWLSMPENWNWSITQVNLDSSFGLISLLLVLDILRSVFVTHRSTYNYDLDVLNVKYLIPGCFLLATLLRPHFHSWTTVYGFVWSSCLYMDVLALMPQVAMMSRGGGKVEAPIAHFVAATFLSRIEDLSDTVLYHGGGLQADENFSWWLICLVQGVHLLLVADFMYYYVKARTVGAGLELPM